MSSKRLLISSLIILGAMVVILASCQNLKNIFIKESARGTEFDHQLHIDEEIDCDACHDKFTESASAGMPTFDTCMVCHEEDREKLATQYLKDNKTFWAEYCALPDEVIFSHKTHFDEKVGCTDCHTGIKKNTRVSKKLILKKESCLKCHPGMTQAETCAKCHKRIRLDQAPDNHKANWDIIHGQIVRQGEDEVKKYRCSLCHRESGSETSIGCTECHQDRKPRDHTNHWRHRGHGLSAGIDRTKCATCHQVDYCDRCHHDTSPRNHTGSWGSPLNRHCLTCHVPLNSQGCNTCHKTMPGHLEAPPKPNNPTHKAATACLTCHSATGLPHLNNGDNCNSCHR